MQTIVIIINKLQYIMVPSHTQVLMTSVFLLLLQVDITL